MGVVWVLLVFLLLLLLPLNSKGLYEWLNHCFQCLNTLKEQPPQTLSIFCMSRETNRIFLQFAILLLIIFACQVGVVYLVYDLFAQFNKSVNGFLMDTMKSSKDNEMFFHIWEFIQHFVRLQQTQCESHIHQLTIFAFIVWMLRSEFTKWLASRKRNFTNIVLPNEKWNWDDCWNLTERNLYASKCSWERLQKIGDRLFRCYVPSSNGRRYRCVDDSSMYAGLKSTWTNLILTLHLCLPLTANQFDRFVLHVFRIWLDAA